jgi:hypothetical protein
MNIEVTRSGKQWLADCLDNGIAAIPHAVIADTKIEAITILLVALHRSDSLRHLNTDNIVVNDRSVGSSAGFRSHDMSNYNVRSFGQIQSSMNSESVRSGEQINSASIINAKDKATMDEEQRQETMTKAISALLASGRNVTRKLNLD